MFKTSVQSVEFHLKEQIIVGLNAKLICYRPNGEILKYH